MKTQINQIFTIVGFFSMSLLTTLTISWGITGLIKTDHQDSLCDTSRLKSKNMVQSNMSCKKVDVNSTFKSLVPKTLFGKNG